MMDVAVEEMVLVSVKIVRTIVVERVRVVVGEVFGSILTELTGPPTKASSREAMQNSFEQTLIDVVVLGHMQWMLSIAISSLWAIKMS